MTQSTTRRAALIGASVFAVAVSTLAWGQVGTGSSSSPNGFNPTPAYATPLSVSTSSSNVSLPVGTVVVIYNTGSSAAYVRLGGPSVSAATSNDAIQPGGWMAFAVGTNTNIAAVTATGTTTLNVSGGSGLPTGAATALPANPAAFYGRSLTLTAAPQAFGALALTNGALCEAAAANSGTVYFGGADMTTSANGVPRAAGDRWSYAGANLSALYAYSTVAGDVVYCYGN